MGLVNDDKLERNVDNNIIEIKWKNFITGNKNLELVKLWRYSVAFHGNVGMVPFVVLDGPTTDLSILVVVKHAVHVGPLLDCAFPVLESRKGSDD